MTTLCRLPLRILSIAGLTISASQDTANGEQGNMQQWADILTKMINHEESQVRSIQRWCMTSSSDVVWYLEFSLDVLHQDFLHGHHHVQHQKGRTLLIIHVDWTIILLANLMYKSYKSMLRGGPHCSRDFHEFCDLPHTQSVMTAAIACNTSS